MANTERATLSTEYLGHLELSETALNRFIHGVLPPYIGICAVQVRPHIDSAVSRDGKIGSWPEDCVVAVEDAGNGRGLLVADADHVRGNFAALAVARAIAGREAKPTRMLVYPDQSEDASGVVLDVGVGRAYFGPEGWSFTNASAVDDLEGADAAIFGMSFLRESCGLSTELLDAMKKQLNLLARDNSETVRQTQKMADEAVRNLMIVVGKKPTKFGLLSPYSPGSSEWAVKLNKKPDNKLVGATHKLLAQLGISLGDLRLSNTDVQIGVDASRQPIVGFSNSDSFPGFIIIGPRENGKKLTIYGRVSDFEENRLNVVADLNTSKKIGVVLAWAAACQEFVTPTE